MATTAMLIRKPVAEVFSAFVNPDITTKFWFSKSTGKLEVGKQIVWIWDMYDVQIPVTVKEMLTNKMIIIEWGNDQTITTVKWEFTSLNDTNTYVTIMNSGFDIHSSHLINQISDSTKGFSFVLAGLKAFLEHGIQLNLIADAFPKGK
jgi:uncharacterized protein YndB with AHSA1/START domain